MRQRLWQGLAVAAAVVAIVMIVLWRMTPTYVATGSLLIEPKRANLARDAEPPPPGGLPPDTSAIDTEVEVLKSPALANDVTRRLKLFDDPEFNTALKSRSSAQNVPDAVFDKTASHVRAHARIKRVGLTYVVQVGFASHSPVKAATIANAYMDAFLQRELDAKASEVEKANSELGGQIERLRENAQEAEAAVQQYKIAHNLYDAEGATMAAQEVSNLNQQIAQAKADAAEKQATLDAARHQVAAGSGGADVSAAVDSQTIRDLRKEEAEKAEQLAQLKAIFEPSYPQVQRTQAELNAVRAQIQAELNRILSSVGAQAAASTQREGSLLGSRNSAQGGLVANNRAQVGLVALQQRADASKQIYETYLTRADQLSAEGSLQQPDAVVASAADLPLKPSSPNKRLGAALAVLLGLIAGAYTI
ncbi:MAG: GumC family protein, partial [Caulobacteraceae bacterium]